MSILENGYYNHVQEKSNNENISLAKLYIEKIPAIRESLQEYKNEDLDKFSARKIETLLAVTLYLKEMGQNLIEYLSATNLKEQYSLFTIQLQLNDFILEILTDVTSAPY